MRGIPDHKREEIENVLIPALETVVIAVITGTSPEDLDHDALRRRYPLDVAESLIVGIEKARADREGDATR